MPKIVGPVGRGEMQYAEMFKAAQRLTTKPVKFGTVTPELVAFAVQDEHYKDIPSRIMAISDAFNEELHDLADAGCPVIQMEEPQIHLLAARDYVDKVINPEFMLKVFNNTVKGLRAKTEVWCHTCWGNPSQQRMFGSVQSLQAGAGAAEPGGRRRDHVRDEELEPAGPRGGRRGDHREEGRASARSTTTRCRWRRRRKWRTLIRAGAEGDSGGAAGAVVGLRHGPRGDEPAARVLQDGGAGAGHEHRPQGAGAAGGRDRSARIRSSR